VVDGSENTQNSYRYEAFGQVQSSTENVTNPYRYIGAYGVHWDPSPALYFMQARYYMASVGRFITAEMILGVGTLYVYTADNPASYFDPQGTAQIDESCKRYNDQVEAGIRWIERNLPRLRAKDPALAACVRDRLSADNPREVVVVCGGGFLCRGQCAYTWAPLIPTRTIHICWSIFASPSCPWVGYAILHEMVHVCGVRDEERIKCERLDLR